MNVKEKIRSVWYKTNIIVPLRGFCLAYESGSLSDAARELGVSQSTVTRQIQAIEREIKTELFHKTPSGKMEPTSDGKFLYELSKPKIQSFDYIYTYFASKENNIIDKDEIKLSAHHTAITNMIPKYIEKYKQNNGGDSCTKFFIKNSSFIDILNDLDNDNIDLAIYPIDEFPKDRRYSEAKYKTNLLFTLNPTIIMHKNNVLSDKNDSEITYNDLKKQNVMMADKDKTLSLYNERCEEHGVKGNIIFENSDLETLRNFVRLNIGIQFYSNIYEIANLPETDLVYKNVSHLFPVIKVKLIIKQGKILNRSLRNFVDVIINVNENFIRKSNAE